MRKNKEKPKFLKNSVGKKVKNSLIPTSENDYSPKALCFKSLSVIVIFLVLAKVFVTLFLFAIYPKFVYLTTDIYDQVIELTNKTRVENGVLPLKTNPILDEAAKEKAQDMFLRQYFSHDTPEGKKPWHWIDRKEYDYTNAGENLAMNFTSAEVAHLALLQSPSHKKNIVNLKFKDIGVAVLTGEMNGKKTMIMVEIFGRQRGAEIEHKNTENTKIREIQKQESVETIKHKNTETQKQNLESSQIAVAKGAVVNKGMKEQDKEIKELRDLEISEADKEPDILGVSSVDPGVKEISVKSSILKSKSNLVNSLLRYLDYILYSGLILIIILLVLNILIKINIQRPAVIFQSIMTIGIIMILIISKFHFFQNLATKVIIG